MGTEGVGYFSYHHLIVAMPNILDQRYLEFEQYKDASRLKARIQLHQRFSTNHYGWFKWLFDQLSLPGGADILEIGCGSGMLWSENKDRIPLDWSITQSDFSPGMLREARDNIGSTDNAFAFIAFNAMAIPYPANTFGAVIANHMLYHVPDRQKALSEIVRVLQPGGKFFAATNGENHLKELSEIVDRYVRLGGKHYSPAFSAGGFTLENGTQQLALWFKQIEIRYYKDGLIVTDAAPLVAYILSMIPHADIASDTGFVAELSSSIDELVSQNGSIHIQKSIGIFVGEK